MAMTCEHVDAVLSAYLEGDLGDVERGEVESHLRQCLRCAALVRDLERIRDDAAVLPPLEPSRELWEGIAARIEAPVIGIGTREAAPRRVWRLAAAAVLLVAVSSGVTYVLATRGGPAELATGVVPAATSDSQATGVANAPSVVVPGRPSGGGAPVLVRAEPLAPEVIYDQEIGRLRTILDQRRADLDSATVATVEKSLRAIDVAIADARAALAQDAGSRFLNDQLNRALERKVVLLRRVALLPLGAS